MDDNQETRGALFPQEEKKSENSPDWGGLLEIDLDDEDVMRGKIKLVGWNSTSKKGQKYISFKKSKPMKETQNSHGRDEWD